MTEPTLDKVQSLADQLSPLDQVRLLEHLIPRIARVVSSSHSTPASNTDAWREFFRLGDELVASDTREMDTLTATVLAMRR